MSIEHAAWCSCDPCHCLANAKGRDKGPGRGKHDTATSTTQRPPGSGAAPDNEQREPGGIVIPSMARTTVATLTLQPGDCLVLETDALLPVSVREAFLGDLQRVFERIGFKRDDIGVILLDQGLKLKSVLRNRDFRERYVNAEKSKQKPLRRVLVASQANEDLEKHF